MTKREKPARRRRAFLPGAALLGLLAASGYLGATTRTPIRTVDAPITRRTLTGHETASLTWEERLAERRTQEIAMLDAILQDGRASAETARSALSQKLQIAECMETETLCAKALLAMGCEEGMAVCAPTGISVFLPWEAAAGEGERTRFIEAICAAADAEPEKVKIILTKK